MTLHVVAARRYYLQNPSHPLTANVAVSKARKLLEASVHTVRLYVDK